MACRGLLLLLVSFDALAKEAKGQYAPVVSMGDLLQIVLSLLLVIFCVAIFSIIVKKLNGMSFNENRKLKTISGLSLGSKERVVLIQVGDKQILLGVSPGGISKIEEFDDPIVNANDSPSFNFKAQFKRFMQQGKSS